MIFYPEVKQLGITSKEKAILGLIRALSRLVLFSQKQLSKSSISLETFSTYVNLVFRQCKQVSRHFQESWATFGREKHHFLPILPIVGMRRIYMYIKQLKKSYVQCTIYKNFLKIWNLYTNIHGVFINFRIKSQKIFLKMPKLIS